MYAVLEIGGQQFRIEKGSKIDVPKLPNKEGDKIEINNVLLYADGDSVEIGTPVLSEYTVLGKIEKHYKGKKVIVHKYKKRKDSKVTRGHRDELTVLLIEDITKGKPKKTKTKAEKVKKEKKTEPAKEKKAEAVAVEKAEDKIKKEVKKKAAPKKTVKKEAKAEEKVKKEPAEKPKKKTAVKKKEEKSEKDVKEAPKKKPAKPKAKTAKKQDKERKDKKE